jgi:hypothetical protein
MAKQDSSNIINMAEIEEATKTTITVPATRPALQDSQVMRLKWKRDQQNIADEVAFVEEQMESAKRICIATRDEADRIYDFECVTAAKRRDGAHADAERVMTATIEALTRRRNDLMETHQGLARALDAGTDPAK